MDFDAYEMSNIKNMECDSVLSSGSWFEADDCGPDCDCDSEDNKDCFCSDCTPLYDGSECMFGD